jgi:hypothetical protein
VEDVMRALIAVILGVGVASSAMAQPGRPQRGTPVIPTNRLVTSESVVVTRPASRPIPSWLSEGLAELQRGGWEPTDLAALKGMLAEGAPALSLIEAAAQPGDDRRHLVIGHAMFDFLVMRAGPDAPARLLTSLTQNPAVTPIDAYLGIAGVSPDEFNRAFEVFVTTRLLAP